MPSIQEWAISLLLLLHAFESTAGEIVCADILFVRNNGSNGVGTQQDPVNVLPFFPSPSFEVIYLFIGSATSFNQDQGIILSPGQKLIGETIGYQDDCNDIPATLSAARPAVANITGSAPITLLGDNEVAGIRVLGSTFGLGIGATGTTGADLHDNVIEGGSIFFSLSQGTTRIVDNEVLDAPGVAIAFVHQGDPMLLEIAGNLMEDGAGEGIALSTMPFNGDMGSIIVRNNTLRRMENEAIELDLLNAQFLIEDNTVVDTLSAAIEIEETGGVGLIRNNEFTDVDPDGIFVRASDLNVLDLTIANNSVVDTRGVDVDNFGNGIVLEARDSGALVVELGNNTIDGKGGTGIVVDALETGSIAIRMESNTVRDVGQLGIRLGASGAGLLQAEVEQNDIDRSGGDGIGYSLASTTLVQSLDIRNNDIDDSEGDGVGVSFSAGTTRQLDLAIDFNRIGGGSGLAVSVATSGAGNGELTFSVRNNTIVGNAEEGVRVGIGGSIQADGHIEANTFSANQEIFAVDASAGGSSALCTVLASNQADNDYRLQGNSSGIHIWEDLLGSNLGDIVLLDNGAQTFGAVGVDSCDEVDLTPVPEPQRVTLVPEPSFGASAALATLVCLWRRRRRTCE